MKEVGHMTIYIFKFSGLCKIRFGSAVVVRVSIELEASDIIQTTCFVSFCKLKQKKLIIGVGCD